MLANHWRLAAGVAIGGATWLVLTAFPLPVPARGLIGWNTGAVAFLALTWTLFLRAGESSVRDHAARRDETRGIISLLVGAATAASLAGIVAALLSVKGESAGMRSLSMGLAALTLVSSWFLLQTIFVIHYAHRHFQVVATAGDRAGFVFPGDPPRTYLDFAYLAVCVGATAQVSDPGVQSTPLRNLVTAHAITSFFYNTAVLALGINILSGLLGH